MAEGDTGHRPKGPKKKKLKQSENTDKIEGKKKKSINNGLLLTPKRETFICDECGQSFVDQLLLKKHKSNSHSLLMREFYCIQSKKCRDHEGFSNINQCKDHGKNKHAIPEHEINEYVTKCRQAAIMRNNNNNHNNHNNNNTNNKNKFSVPPPLPPTPNGNINITVNSMSRMNSPSISGSKSRSNKKRPNFANRLSNTSNAFGAVNGGNGSSSCSETTLNGSDSQSTISQEFNGNLNQIITNHHNNNNPNPFKQTPLQTQV